MLFALILFISVKEIASAEWRELLPWAKSMPEEDFRKHIEIRLVKKDWLPQGFTVPEGDGLYDTYPGSTEEAYKIFREAPLYEYFSRPLDTAQELLSSQFGYDRQLDSIVIIHSILGTADIGFVKTTVAALGLRNAIKHFNVFTLNMPGLRTLLYQTGIKSALGRVGNMYGVARTIGGFFNKAIQKSNMVPGQINFIGFSLSSQVCGYVARNIMNNNNGLKVGSIVALDPHSIGLSSILGQFVSSNDARVVHAYHTNSMIMGTFFRRATADFVFNNGNVQPGCTVSDYSCNHRKSVLILWYIILNKHQFVARSCKSYILFALCLCQSHDTVLIAYPPEETAKGLYYLKTREHKPYGYGPPGADCPLKAAKDDYEKDHANDKEILSAPQL